MRYEQTSPPAEIYLDANATTPVLPQAARAALAAMCDDFGNPSSLHGTGLRARALVDAARACARRVLGAPAGRLLFTSGATEGIQTAVLSTLAALRDERDRGGDIPPLLLVGATEHKAVPESLQHWNALLKLGCRIEVIPVDAAGRHDLAWLRERAPRAGLVCTMAANNETGVVSDLDGIARALAGGRARWLVDGVQALGKLPLRLAERGIDYAPFSGHKLYAPKGIGLLYVREGAPFTPLMAGGGQEAAQRAGTENMAGIAALGAVLAALESGVGFRDAATLAGFRDRLAEALGDAFPGLVFNAPAERCLPTTLNVSVPGLASRQLLDVFDAAGVRASGGSACSAAGAQPSAVLEAMGLPAWQAASAVRLSFGPAADEAFIAAACERLRACGRALRDSGQLPELPLPTVGTNDDPAAALLSPDALWALLAAHPDLELVDVREVCEQRAGPALALASPSVLRRAVALSQLAQAMPEWLASPGTAPLVFWCRSGSRSLQAATALRRLGHRNAWSLAGGLALWRPEADTAAAPATTPASRVR